MSQNAAPIVPEPINRASVADSVFDHVRRQILTLELEPGTKISEVDIATALGVSRQPVRDAFYRLSQVGFLVIRPQRATTVSLISRRAVMQARFIRTALEAATIATASERLTPQDYTALRDILDLQRIAMDAGEKTRFHQLDDQFHYEICRRAGLEFTWDLIYEHKAHMDRVRLLSLSFASQDAFDDHLAIFEHMQARRADRASAALRVHLGRIQDQFDRIQAAHDDWFSHSDDTAPWF